MLSSHTHDMNLEALNSDDVMLSKYCYAIAYNETIDRLVGCCLFDEKYHANHDIENGNLVHLDPDFGHFTETVES